MPEIFERLGETLSGEIAGIPTWGIVAAGGGILGVVLMINRSRAKPAQKESVDESPIIYSGAGPEPAPSGPPNVVEIPPPEIPAPIVQVTVPESQSKPTESVAPNITVNIPEIPTTGALPYYYPPMYEPKAPEIIMIDAVFGRRKREEPSTIAPSEPVKSCPQVQEDIDLGNYGLAGLGWSAPYLDDGNCGKKDGEVYTINEGHHIGFAYSINDAIRLGREFFNRME